MIHTEYKSAIDSLGLMIPHIVMLLIIGGAILLILGSRRTASKLLILGIAMAVIGPVLHSLTGPVIEIARHFPWWLRMFFGSMIALGLLRLVLIPFLGRDAAAGAVGSLASIVIMFIFRVAFLPLRIIQNLIQHR